MRLVTLRTADGTRAARQEAGMFTEVPGYADVGALLFEPRWREIATGALGQQHAAAQMELAPVIVRPGRIVCVGLNYRSHILEMGRELPRYPTLFAKFADALTGPSDDVELPPEDPHVDWEGELAVVMGRAARRVSEGEAGDYIAGYTIANDVSMREWQFRTKEWLQGKSWERSTPLGPALVTPDELPTGALIRTMVDGEVMQEAKADDLVHGPEHLVSYISSMTTLETGDVILTGTPGGVGHARQPPRYLRAGELLETTIEGLGKLSNRTVLARQDA